MGFAIAALHFLALGVGFLGVVLRGLELRLLQNNIGSHSTRRVLLADNLWALAALLWLSTGLIRVFGPFDKGDAFYLQSHWFWLKMTLFLFIFLLEIFPIVTFVRWRAQKKTHVSVTDVPLLQRLVLINSAEFIILLILPFVAAIMARGGIR